MFSPFLSLADLPGYLGYNHHCDGFSNHHDDDVEGICCVKFWKQVVTGNGEVKRENAQTAPVPITAVVVKRQAEEVGKRAPDK